MIKIPMVRGAAFHPLCQLLDEAGVNSARLLHKFGLSPRFAGTESPCEEGVPSRSFSEFIVEAHRQSGIKEFGLVAGSRTPVHSIGDLGNVLEQSFTVHALIRKFAELMPLINSGSESWLVDGDEPGSIRFCHRQILKTGHAQIDGYAIPIFIDGVRLGAGPTWRPKWIALHPAAGGPEMWEAISDAKTRPDSDFFAFEIPKKILRMRLPFAKVRKHEDAETNLRSHSLPSDLSSAVAQTVRAAFGARIPTIEQAADFAGSSSRTLRRQLREEHATSYKKIVDQTRIREAFDLMENEDLLIEEISHHLGYSNQANFTHAFQRWTGRAPSEYRNPNSITV